MPTESNIELRPNVPVCVFVPDQLDKVSLPDHSTIDNNMLTSMFDDTLDDSVSCTKHKQYPFATDIASDSMNAPASLTSILLI